MAFINLEESDPTSDGMYRVMVNSSSQEPYESTAQWTTNDGFDEANEKLKPESFIVSWWQDDKL